MKKLIAEFKIHLMQATPSLSTTSGTSTTSAVPPSTTTTAPSSPSKSLVSSIEGRCSANALDYLGGIMNSERVPLNHHTPVTSTTLQPLSSTGSSLNISDDAKKKSKKRRRHDDDMTATPRPLATSAGIGKHSSSGGKKRNKTSISISSSPSLSTQRKLTSSRSKSLVTPLINTLSLVPSH